MVIYICEYMQKIDADREALGALRLAGFGGLCHPGLDLRAPGARYKAREARDLRGLGGVRQELGGRRHLECLQAYECLKWPKIS